MARVIWNQLKGFTSGVNRGMFYPTGSAGVPWNGLISVDDGSNNETPTAVYLDGVKVYNRTPRKEYTANLSAYTYPPEFEEYNGYEELTAGVYFDERNARLFGFSYRTGHENGSYRIHIVYNVIATPSASTATTMTNQGAASTLTWSLISTPIVLGGYQAVSHVVLDSRKADPGILRHLEDILYGNEVREPRLPTPLEISELSAEDLPVSVTRLGDGNYEIWAPSYYLETFDDGLFEFTGPTSSILDDGRFEVHSEGSTI